MIFGYQLSDKFINIKSIYLFFVVPLVLNLFLIGFYFSGIDFFQKIISPSGALTRESGLLEQLQNVYLLSIFGIFSYTLVNRKVLFEKIFFAFLSAIFLFLFLEEIDYGISLYEYLTGKSFSGTERNWHNQLSYGKKQNVHYFKQLIDLIGFLWFIVLPLAASKIKIPIIKSFLPNRWFIIAAIMTIIYSQIAHGLDDLGFGMIDGVHGSLAGNISEFREHNTYYLYLLYALQIVKSKLIFSFKSD